VNRRTANALLSGVAGCLALGLSVGCGARPAPGKKTMRIDEVPPAFMETARRELPGIEFNEVWVKKDGTLEIRGKAANGKIREVEIRPDGSVEEAPRQEIPRATYESPSASRIPERGHGRPCDCDARNLTGRRGPWYPPRP